MDSIDRAIISELVADGRLSNVDLAERVRLSPSACLRRVRALERDRVIRGYHLAFTIGAIAVAVGILTALVVLRTRPQQDAAPEAAQIEPLPTDGPAFDDLGLDLFDPEFAAELGAEYREDAQPFRNVEALVGGDVESY